LAALLYTEDDIEVVGEAGTWPMPWSGSPPSARPSSSSTSSLPDRNGVALFRDLHAVAPTAGCLMWTTCSDDEALFDAIAAGAAGYLLKQIPGHDLAAAAIRAIPTGRCLLDPAVTKRVLDRLRNPPAPDPKLAALTDTERKVLDLIGQGLTDRQIAGQTHLAEKTVKNNVSRMLAKLARVERRTQAALYLVETQHPDRDHRG